MKLSFSVLLVAALASLSLVAGEENGRIGSAVSSGPNDAASAGLFSRRLEDEPWENGTEVFKSDGENSIYGEITGYDNGMYNIEWEDGTTGFYSEVETDDFVEAAFEEETDVPTGEDTDVPTGEDTDAPTDEGTDAETDVPMMTNAAEVALETDTPTDEGSETESPTEEETETEAPTDEGTDAGDDDYDDDPWEVGTDVYKVFDDGPFFGKITGYEEGYYTIRWSDGDVEEYSERDIDRLVEAAAARAHASDVVSQTGNFSVNRDNDGMKRGGLAALVSCFVIVAAYCGFKRCRKQEQREFDTNKLPDPCYMDDPESELEMGENKGDSLPKFD